MANETNLAKIFDDFREFLKDQLDPDHGLLRKLRSRGALSREEIDKVSVQQTYRERNNQLIEFVSKRHKSVELVAALREDDQSHIANYLEAAGSYDSLYGTDWPLTDGHLQVIDVNEDSFVDLLEPDCGLINHLLAKNVINNRQKETIESNPIHYKRNETLLSLIRRRSISHFLKVIECLKVTNQTHLAKALAEGGAIVPLHAKTIGNLDDIDEDEELISSTLSELILGKLHNKSSVQTARILENVRLKVVAAKRGNSIVIYVYCKVGKDWTNLKQLLESGRLNGIVGMIYRGILPKMREVKVITRIENEKLEKTEQFFRIRDKISNSGIPSLSTDSNSPEETDEKQHHITRLSGSNQLNGLPLELLDLILQKSYLYSALLKCSIKDRSDEHFMIMLSSVEACWFQRIKKKRFKKRVWSILPKCYNQRRHMSLLYISNQQYFEHCTGLKRIIRRMTSADFLSDIETVRLLRKKSVATHHRTVCSYRVSELFNLGRKTNEVGHNTLVRTLRLNNEIIMARVLDNAGAVFRIEIKEPSGLKKETFVKRLNDLRDKNQARSVETDSVFSQLRQNNIEIIDSTDDREVVVWMWCKSVDARDELYKLNKTQRLSDIISKLAKERSQCIECRHINIDLNNFRKEIVSSSICIDFQARLHLQDETKMVGVTKLRNKIYVLCRNESIFSSQSPATSVCVFKDHCPFNLLENVTFKEIKFPLDIKASQKGDCLYVVDEGEKVIWKINQDEENKDKLIKWIEFEEDFQIFSVSVTSDGQLLMFSRFPKTLLRLHSPDGKLCLSMYLHADIAEPRSAVQTSTGNFIIFHQYFKPIEITSRAESRGETEVRIAQIKTRIIEFPIISEVSRDGNTIIRRFIPDNEGQKFSPFGAEVPLWVDSEDRILIAGTYNHRVILLDSNLRWDRILIPGKEESRFKDRNDRKRMFRLPTNLFYGEIDRQLLIGGELTKKQRYVDVYTFGSKL